MRSIFLFSILIFQTARSYSNDSLIYYFNNGNMAYEQHNFTEAIAQYNLALKLDSTFYAACFARGMAYYQIKKVDSAMADFNKCVSINPKNINAYLQRAVIKASMSDYGGALMDYEVCHKLDPADSQIDLYIEYCKLNLHGF
jgi:tetratricopeptide (TPR) repeat protein